MLGETVTMGHLCHIFLMGWPRLETLTLFTWPFFKLCFISEQATLTLVIKAMYSCILSLSCNVAPVCPNIHNRGFASPPWDLVSMRNQHEHHADPLAMAFARSNKVICVRPKSLLPVPMKQVSFLMLSVIKSHIIKFLIVPCLFISLTMTSKSTSF